MTLIQPVLQHEALQADIAESDPGEGLAIWWLGQSGFLVKSSVGRVLFDPYLSDSLTRKYQDTDKQHVRMTELAIAPSRLREIDVVTSTHNHTDHLDAETLAPLIDANPQMRLLIPEANRTFVADRLGCDPQWPLGLSDGESTTIGEIVVHAVPAAHNEIDRDTKGRCRCLGYVVKLGATTIYHSGDTLLYPGMAERLRPFQVDVAILPINGMRPERRVAGNLFGDEAARLASEIGARIVLPCHFEMFAFNTESPDRFVETCRQLDQKCRVLRCGERFVLQPRP